jgi:hypothetical protein
MLTIRLVTSAIADACLHGVARRKDTAQGRERPARSQFAPEASVVYSGRRG